MMLRRKRRLIAAYKSSVAILTKPNATTILNDNIVFKLTTCESCKLVFSLWKDILRLVK